MQRLIEFEYPLDSLDQGKVFVYKRSPIGEYFYVEQKRIREEGIDYIIQETFDTGKKRVSFEKYRITDNGKELIEEYLYRYSDSLSDSFTKNKAEIFEHKNLQGGEKYKGTNIELHITIDGNIYAESITKETFKREDKLAFGDRNLDVIIYDYTTEIVTSYKYIPFSSSESVYVGENIYARRFGLIKYWEKNDNERLDWELVEIRNLD